MIKELIKAILAKRQLRNTRGQAAYEMAMMKYPYDLSYQKDIDEDAQENYDALKSNDPKRVQDAIDDAREGKKNLPSMPREKPSSMKAGAQVAAMSKMSKRK